MGRSLKGAVEAAAQRTHRACDEGLSVLDQSRRLCVDFDLDAEELTGVLAETVQSAVTGICGIPDGTEAEAEALIVLFGALWLKGFTEGLLAA